MTNRYECFTERGCRSPLACGGFGYCRERNFDGTTTDEHKIARLRAEERARRQSRDHATDDRLSADTEWDED
mgnify:FL=1